MDYEQRKRDREQRRQALLAELEQAERELKLAEKRKEDRLSRQPVRLFLPFSVCHCTNF